MIILLTEHVKQMWFRGAFKKNIGKKLVLLTEQGQGGKASAEFCYVKKLISKFQPFCLIERG